MNISLPFSLFLWLVSSPVATTAKKGSSSGGGGGVYIGGGSSGTSGCSTVSDYVGRGLAKYTLLGREPISYGCRRDSGAERSCEIDILDDGPQDADPTTTTRFPCTGCAFEYGDGVESCVNVPCDRFACVSKEESAPANDGTSAAGEIPLRDDEEEAPATPSAQSSDIEDCAAEYQFTQELSDKLTVELTIRRPGESEAGPEAAELRARLTYRGEGWVGFGISPEGRMRGSDAVVGRPADDDLSGMYRLGDYTIDGISLLPEDEQTLTEFSLEQSDGQTVMTFAKVLNEEGEFPIDNDGGGVTNFIWAYGDSNSFGYHGFNRGFTPFTLPACVTDVDGQQEQQPSFEPYVAQFCSSAPDVIEPFLDQALAAFFGEDDGDFSTDGFECSCSPEFSSEDLLRIDCRSVYSSGGGSFRNAEWMTLTPDLAGDEWRFAPKSVGWCDGIEDGYEEHCEYFDYCDDDGDAAGDRRLCSCSASSTTGGDCASCEVCPDGKRIAMDCSGADQFLNYTSTCEDTGVDANTGAFLTEFDFGSISVSLGAAVGLALRPGTAAEGRMTDPAASSSAEKSVEYCLESTQSMYFNVQQTSDSCILATQMMKIGQIYRSGVTNVKRMDVLFKKEQTADEAAQSLGACEFLVDDEKCRVCQLCEEYEEGLFAADCTNMADGAIATCDMPDGFGAIGASLFVLEDGYVAPHEEEDGIMAMSKGAMRMVRGAVVVATAVVSSTWYLLF